MLVSGDVAKSATPTPPATPSPSASRGIPGGIENLIPVDHDADSRRSRPGTVGKESHKHAGAGNADVPLESLAVGHHVKRLVVDGRGINLTIEMNCHLAGHVHHVLTVIRREPGDANRLDNRQR